MALQAKTGFTGLMTNIAETQSPPGALLEAENVVIRKPGAIECRDGVNKVATVSGGSAVWGFSWRSKDFFVRNNGSNVFDWRDTAGGTYQYYDVAILANKDPQPLRRDIFSRAESRSNLYLPCDFGVVKKETDAGAWKRAGLPLFAAVTLATSGASGFLANNEQVVYRVVCTRTDANGVKITSIPTGQYLISNTTGGSRDVQVFLSANGNVAALGMFDYFEVYRSRNFPTSVTPDDELMLVATVPASSSTSIVDSVLPTARGRTLYTSPSRGGISEQNDSPPAAALVAPFRGSVFFGNVRGPRRIVFSHRYRGDVSGVSTGVGYRVASIDTTNGSPTLLNVTPTTGLEKGMVLTSVNVVGTPHITNISGSTVTLSGNAFVTGTDAAARFYDAVKVNGTWMAATDLHRTVVSSDGDEMLAYTVTPAEGGYTHTYAIEAHTRDTTARTVQATHGIEYNPALPGYDAAAKSMDQDTLPGGLYWSKPDEPEHVRPGDFAYVGDKQRAILGLVPTRDALFVLKEDGVFRLTGFNGEWRIDPFDPNCFCVLPMGVQVLNGRALFLSAEGVVALDDGGVELVSRPINDQVKLTIDQIMANWRANSFYEVNGSQGACYSAVFDRENEYTLMRSSEDNHLVYNADTGAWTTWKYHAHVTESYANRAVFAFASTGRIIYSMGADYYETVLSTQVSANYERSDRVTAITVSSYVAGTATLSAPITALEDDIIEDANERFWRITADVVGSVSVPVQLGGGTATMATGPAIMYRSQRGKVVATGYTDPGAAQKSWGSFLTAWQRLQGAVLLKYAYQSSESADWEEEDARSSVSVSAPGAVGSGYTAYGLGFTATGRVPNSHARAWLLRARVRWAMAFGQAQLEGLAAEFTPMLPGSHQQVAA
jgi:hypothetical protein